MSTEPNPSDLLIVDLFDRLGLKSNDERYAQTFSVDGYAVITGVVLMSNKKLEFEWLGRSWHAYVCDENEDVIRSWSIKVDPDDNRPIGARYCNDQEESRC